MPESWILSINPVKTQKIFRGFAPYPTGGGLQRPPRPPSCKKLRYARYACYARFKKPVNKNPGSAPADLVELPTLSKKKSGFRYILMVIDVFSKYGWSVPLKTKTGKEVASALRPSSKRINLLNFGLIKVDNFTTKMSLNS